MSTFSCPRTLTLLFLVGGLSSLAAQTPPPTLNVRDSGAVGDGSTKDTASVQKAIDLAASKGGGEIDFPAGTYLIGSVELKSHVGLHLEKGATLAGSPDADDYPVAPARWEGIERPCHQALICAHAAEDIAITGDGTIEGNAALGTLRDPRAPTVIEPISCKNVRVEGVTLKSTRIWTLHPTYCQDVKIAHVTFETTGSSSDGIDPDSCQRVLIDGCTFTNGDDNIAIKSGKGQEGVRIGKPCEDITITRCTFLKGYSGIAFGSELSGGIRRVNISDCTFKNGRAALYLKSRAGRAGYVRDVRASHLVVGPEALLEVHTTYSSNADSQGVPGVDGLTPFSSIEITDVTADVKGLVRIDATPEKPLDGLVLRNITGTCKEGWVLRNAKNVEIRDIHLSGFAGPPFLTANVQGTGLDGAAPLPSPYPSAK